MRTYESVTADLAADALSVRHHRVRTSELERPLGALNSVPLHTGLSCRVSEIARHVLVSQRAGKDAARGQGAGDTRGQGAGDIQALTFMEFSAEKTSKLPATFLSGSARARMGQFWRSYGLGRGAGA